MDELDLNNVRAFHEVSQALSFSKAAEILGITQPAVSMRVQALEEQLGVSLFERGPRGARLTPNGESFAPVADSLLRLAAQAVESARPSLADLQGCLRIACCSAAGKYLLPELVAAFLRQYPEVDVQIRTVSRPQLLDGLLRDDVDIGVTSVPIEGGDLEHSPFFTDHLSLIVPAAHPWARRGQVQAPELLGERFICREPESACRRVVQAGLQPLGVEMMDLLIVMEVGSAEALAMAVERGIGIAFVSKLAAQPRVSLGRLVMVEVEGAQLTNPVTWVQSPTHAASPELKAFQQVVHQPALESLIQSLAEGHLL